MISTQLSTLQPSTDVLDEFPRWVIQYCNRTSVVLDVGAGRGLTKSPATIRRSVARLVGVDPDAAVEQNPYLDECHQAPIEEFAKGRGCSFDCLYTMYVLEHVTHPVEFLSACRSLLKPGGVLFGATPNLWHYFGMTTKLSASLGIEDWLLDHIIGTQRKEAYHYPTAYRLNDIHTIRHMLEQTGFREVEFRCLDHPQSFEYVFPKLLRWFPGLYSRLVYTVRLPQVMGFIMFRATA